MAPEHVSACHQCLATRASKYGELVVARDLAVPANRTALRLGKHCGVSPEVEPSVKARVA